MYYLLPVDIFSLLLKIYLWTLGLVKFSWEKWGVSGNVPEALS